MTKPKIEQKHISELKLDENNARRRTETSAGIIKRSLSEFGGVRSGAIDENDKVWAGNGTVEEARKLGIEKVTIVEAEGDELVMVRRRGLTEEQWKKYAIADNTASDFSTWDAEVLSEISGEVDLSSFFPNDKLEEILGQLSASGGDFTDKEEDEDELNDLLDKVEDGEIEPRVKLGEIWECGRHRICCGDSTVEKNVRALLGDRKVDLLITDPPYGVKVVGGTKDPRSKDYQSGKSIQNDDIQGDELREFLLNCFKATDSVMREGACYYIAHPDIFAYEFIGAVRDTGWKQARPPVVLWVKDSFVFGQGDYHSRSEPILYGWKPGAAHKPVSDRTQDNVWEYGRPRNTKEIHPSVKPTELIEKMILNSSEPNWLIYDPFLGSGTTILAAQKLEGTRSVFGFELSEKYCEVIIQRWENFTGQTAKLVGHLPK